MFLGKFRSVFWYDLQKKQYHPRWIMSTQKTDWKRMIEGKLYNSASKDIFWQHAKGMYLTQKLNKCPIWNAPRQKRILNRLIPSSKGKSMWVFTPFYCEYGVNIHVGNDVFVNYSCTLLDISPITLEDGVWLGANVTIATPCHPLIAAERVNQNYPDGYHDLEYSKPVRIQKNAWIASNVVICGGVTIGEGSVIGAGSVVTRDIPAECIAVGNPCRVLRKIDEDDRIDVWNTYINDEMPLSIRDKEKLAAQK